MRLKISGPEHHHYPAPGGWLPAIDRVRTRSERGESVGGEDAVGEVPFGEGATMGGEEGEEVCEPTRFGAPKLMAGGETENADERSAVGQRGSWSGADAS